MTQEANKSIEEMARRLEEQRRAAAAASSGAAEAGPEDEVKADAAPQPSMAADGAASGQPMAAADAGPEDVVTADTAQQPMTAAGGAVSGQPGTAGGEGAIGAGSSGVTTDASGVTTDAGGVTTGSPYLDDPYGDDEAVASAQQAQAIADNQVLTDAKKQGVDDATMRAALVNAPDDEARKQMLANWLASGQLKWGDVKRLETEAAEDLDPELKAKRQKREQRERDMVGLLSMVGALGNLVNATTSRNGRSVPVADLSKAVNEKQATDYAMRQERMKRLQDAKDKYGAVRGSIIWQAQQDYAARMKQAQAEQLARDKMAADQAKQVQAANLKREEWDRRDALEERKAERAKELKELENRTRITAARIAASGKGKSSGSGKGSTSKPKEYKVDGQTYKLRSEVLTDFAVGQLFGIQPQEYQDEIKKAQKAADGRGRGTEDDGKTDQYSYNSTTINMLLGKYSKDAANHKLHPENFEEFKDWLGVLADAGDDEGEGAAEVKDHKDDPYGDEAETGGDEKSDKDDPYGEG